MKIKFKFRKARSIKKALKYFDPHSSLWDDRGMASFYVQRNGFHVDEIIKTFRQSNNYPKILFSGPPGCGKATELAKINDIINKKFNVISVSAKTMTNDYKLEPNVMLYHILRLVSDVVKEKNKKVFDEKLDTLVKRFQGWQTRKANIDTEGKKAPPGMIQKILNFEESFSGNLESESKLLEKPSLNEMIGGINTAAETLEKRRFFIFPGKSVLILFYDLDKLEIESAREIFMTTFLPLIKIKCNAIYTFPLVLKFEKEFITMFRNFSQIYFLENFKIREKNGDINVKEYEKLVNVIQKRMHDKIIYQETIEKAVKLSGGILFELINIIRQCCIIALRERINFIDNDILEEAEERIRLNYKIALTKEDRQNLYIINQTKKIPKNVDLAKLFSQYCVTEYGKGENVWYDVSPILIPLLLKPGYEEE